MEFVICGLLRIIRAISALGFFVCALWLVRWLTRQRFNPAANAADDPMAVNHFAVTALLCLIVFALVVDRHPKNSD
jgi:hypothetical protein